jgi:hypothetical protein
MHASLEPVVPTGAAFPKRTFYERAAQRERDSGKREAFAQTAVLLRSGKKVRSQVGL